MSPEAKSSPMRHAAKTVRAEARYVWSAAVRAVRQSGRERDLLVQSLKSALAALAAWALASWWLPDTLSLMAPWVAVVLVQATVYRSVSQGVRQAAAILLGTALATGTALTVGHTVIALALVLPVTLLIGNWPRFGGQGIAVATSAIFAVTGGDLTLMVSVERVLAALIGAVVGIAVNALVFPPAYLRSSEETLLGMTREAGAVLDEMADGLSEGLDPERAQRWFDRADRLPQRVEDVRSALEWSQESMRMNLTYRRRLPGFATDISTHDVVNTLWHVSDHIRDMTRTLLEAAESRREDGYPVLGLADTYADFLRVVARAVTTYGESTVSDEESGQQDLAEAVERMDAAHDQLHQQFGELPAPDSADVELLGPLLAEARRLSRQLRT
ncbi:FUSC family protein [Streptomyces sparsus]